MISSVTLQELEHIKVSGRKSEEVKYNARKALHILDENSDKYTAVVFTTAMENYINEKLIEVTPDSKIVATAAFSKNLIPQEDDFVFITNDLACKVIAQKIFNLPVESVDEESGNEIYKGYQVIQIGRASCRERV